MLIHFTVCLFTQVHFNKCYVDLMLQQEINDYTLRRITFEEVFLGRTFTLLCRINNCQNF